MSFSCILEGVWGGFGGPLAPLGEDLESPWRLLVDFWASFLGACTGNALQKGSWRVLGGSWARFWFDFGGSGRDLGTVWMGFWEGFGTVWETFWRIVVENVISAAFYLFWHVLVCF